MAKSVKSPKMVLVFKIRAAYRGGYDEVEVRARTVGRAKSLAVAEFSNWLPESNPMNKSGFSELEIVESY